MLHDAWFAKGAHALVDGVCVSKHTFTDLAGHERKQLVSGLHLVSLFQFINEANAVKANHSAAQLTFYQQQNGPIGQSVFGCVSLPLKDISQ